ncbi:MAG: hypothetical protein IPK34_07080 [Ramlibacter sp.]|nr:hypothetical protein [Ramlibacter sp.]
MPLGTITATSLAFGTANTAYSLNGNITLTNNPLTFDAAVTMLGNPYWQRAVAMSASRKYGGWRICPYGQQLGHDRL